MEGQSGLVILGGKGYAGESLTKEMENQVLLFKGILWAFIGFQ